MLERRQAGQLTGLGVRDVMDGVMRHLQQGRRAQGRCWVTDSAWAPVLLGRDTPHSLSGAAPPGPPALRATVGPL